ncbi:MAG TPA: helix-turn-helix domain-containing protein [Sinorhizobium sp.]|nr:helix-turn-helix domain-containing protein [Sinorhizobium sp.]
MALSKRERDRLVVLRQVKERRMKQKTAAEQLGLSVRWVKKLLGRMRREGDRGLAHRLRGRPSNRGHGARLPERALRLIQRRYSDYGPTLASEVLAQEHGIVVNRETLRQWMSEQKLWRPRRARACHLLRHHRGRELVSSPSQGDRWES